MHVDYDQLALASQTLRRQSDVHLAKAAQYIPQYGILTPADTGIVLQPFTAASLAVAVIGVQAVDAFGRVFSVAADKVDDAAETYARHEEQAYQEYAHLMQRLGVSVAPWTDPRDSAPSLGAAQGAAPADLGAGEPDLVTELAGLPGQVADDVTDLWDNASSRVQSWSQAGGVVERSDASSWLVVPNATKSEIENMRWGAGPILGGVDWLIEQLTGLSLLEDVIMKPFAGDWTGIEEVQQAWTHLGEFMRAISDNGAGLAETGVFWEGDAGSAYQGGMVALSAMAFGLGAAADTVAALVGNLLMASKAAAAAIGFALRKLSNRLLRMAAEAAVPVVGWLADAAEAAIAVSDIFATIRLIYSVINIITDAIESVLEAKAQLVESALRLEDLIQVLTQNVRKYA